MPSQRTALLALSVICLLGVALRLHDFGAWWLNPDEGLHYGVAVWPEWSRFWTELGRNAHPPLWFVALRAVGAVSADAIAMRLLSLIFGVAAIVGVYLATRELADRASGLFAATMMAASEAAAVQSQVIRPYTMQLAALGFGLGLLGRWVRVRRTRDLVGWSALFTLALLVHYSTVIALGAAATAVALMWLRGKLTRGAAGRFALAQIPIAGVGLWLWTTHISEQLWGSRLQDVARTTWLGGFYHDRVVELGPALVGTLRYWFGDPYAISAVVIFSFGIGVAAFHRQLLLAALAIGGVVIGFGLSLAGIHPFGGSRHSIYLIVLTLPCAAAGIAFALGRGAPERSLPWLPIFALALFAAPLARGTSTPLALPPGDERVVSTSALGHATPMLRGLRSDGGLLVADWQTYMTLMPYFVEARSGVRQAEGSRSIHFGWGAATVLVSPAWRLRTDAMRPEARDHLLAFLEHASTVHPDLGIETQKAGTLMFAGWATDRIRASLPRIEALAAGCVGIVQGEPGFGWAAISPDLCLRSTARDRGRHPATLRGPRRPASENTR